MPIHLVFNPEVGWSGESRSQTITRREMDVLLMCARGFSNKETAERLGIKYQTVKNTLYRLSKKLGAKNSTHALFLALNAGLIHVEHVATVVDEGESVKREPENVRRRVESKRHADESMDRRSKRNRDQQ